MNTAEHRAGEKDAIYLCSIFDKVYRVLRSAEHCVRPYTEYRIVII